MLGLSTCCFCPLFAPMPISAIVVGRFALIRIAKDEGGLRGRRLAYLGMGLGVLALAAATAFTIYRLVSGDSLAALPFDR